MPNTFRRYESKYLLSEAKFRALMARLPEYMQSDRHCRDGQSYTIYNIYYDTANHDLIRHSLAKPYFKQKLRLRSYTIPGGPNDRVFVELKKKIGGVVAKRRAAMPLAEAYAWLAYGQQPVKADYLQNQVIEEIAFFLNCYQLEPKVSISYARIAFFGKEDKEFRVTFDCHIQTRRHNLRLEQGALGRNLLADQQYLMEIKIPGAIPFWLCQTLSELKLYSTGFSKYGREYQNYCQERPVKFWSLSSLPIVSRLATLQPKYGVN